MHYSSLKNIKKLLLEKDVSFRISEANFMNDPSEGEKLLEILKLHSGKKNAPSQFHPKAFIGSFVPESMYDELLLWRTYGKEEEHEGKGCSLSLNSEKFISEIKKKMKEVLKNKQDQDNKLNNIENTTETSRAKENKDGAPLLSSDTMVLHKPTDNIQAYELYRVAYRNKSGEIIIPVQGEKKDKEEKESTNELDNKLKKIKNELENIEKNQEANAYAKEMLTEIQYLFKGEEYKHECEIRLIVPGEGIPKKIKESRVYIETTPIVPVLKKITIGPTVEKREELAANFYYHLEEEKPKIELSQHSFK